MIWIVNQILKALTGRNYNHFVIQKEKIHKIYFTYKVVWQLYTK